MSTYNGAKYLSEQLESILAQTGVSLHILIRDDGSTDNTMSILNHFKNLHPSIIDIYQGQNIGWKNSFFTLAKLAEDNYDDYEYFAFSDQDDIWLPDKLNRSINKLSELKDGPNLYCSNLTYYKDGRQSGNLRKIDVKPSYKGCLIRNYATGCTIVFNRRLLSLFNKQKPKYPIAHDYWSYLIATLCGNTIIDPYSRILYRQHDSNQIGATGGFINVWKRRLKSIQALMGSHDKELIASDLLRIHSDSMNAPAKKAVYKIVCYRNSIFSKLALMFDKGYTYDSMSNDFWLKLRILFGKL